MRAFIALELPRIFADGVAELARGLATVCDGRFVPVDSYHLTLAFLGELDEAGVRAALGALGAACVGTGPVELEAEGIGTFGRGRSTTLWLGVRPSEELGLLASRVRGELAARGVSYDEKPFRPHVTLARRARLPRGGLPGSKLLRPGAARSVTLFRSILAADGARYKSLHTVELGWGMPACNLGPGDGFSR